jgi:hypothetical protein
MVKEPSVRPRVRTALQINMHPLDWRHVMLTLDHQLRVWARQVERISITLDTQRSRSGRYRGVDYDGSRERLVAYLAARQAEHPHLEIVEVDYSDAARERVRRAYFNRETAVPAKAFDGGPFHAYFYGLLAANADYVVHMDSDMLFGGASQTWLEEAIAWLKLEPDALFVGPLPGPPRADGLLNDAHRRLPGRSRIPAPERVAADYPAWRFHSVSTRIFVLAERRFQARVGSLALVAPSARRRLRARLYGESATTAPAEEVLTDVLLRHHLTRIDFLGSGAGLYSLHPLYRSETFYRELPQIIARIEAGDIPDGQRGDYDLNASMIDWSEALRQKTPLKRARRALAHLGDALFRSA